VSDVFFRVFVWWMQLGGRFRASKAAQSRRGEAKNASPRTPSGSPAVGRAAALGAALAVEDSFEFPHAAEGILCKIAARAPLRVERQPLEQRGLLAFACAFWWPYPIFPALRSMSSAISMHSYTSPSQKGFFSLPASALRASSGLQSRDSGCFSRTRA